MLTSPHASCLLFPIFESRHESIAEKRYSQYPMNAKKEYNERYRSDRRVKGGKQGLCPYCLENKTLILSHILPKWSFKWAKSEGNGTVVGSYPSIGVKAIEQDGSKHYILCQKCDQDLGDAELYVKSLMLGTDKELMKIGVTRANEVFFGVNLKIIKKFMLGLCLKAHYATSAPWHKIILKNELLEEIRSHLNSPTNEDAEFPITAMQFESGLSDEIDPKAISIPVLQETEDGLIWASFLMAGWEWLVVLKVGTSVLPEVFSKHRLRSNGNFPVYIGEILDQRFLNGGKFLTRRERRELKRRKKK